MNDLFKVISWQGKVEISSDDMWVLDACLFGATAYEVANVTGFSHGKVKRHLGRLRSMGLLRCHDEHRGRKARVHIWTRDGPED